MEAAHQDMMHQIFGNNLINWVIFVGLIAFFWQKFMPPMFEARRQRIQGALDEAARAKAEGEAFLTQQRERIANAENEAQKILEDAKVTAQSMRSQESELIKKEIAELEKKLDQQISTHRQMVITELRSQAAVAAVRLAEASLPGAITDNVKKGLQERFVTQLDQIGANKK
jgi:F-type H+-transporting ATPase subunit b